MKVLLATKFYFRRGGDGVYTLGLEELLRAHGHETVVFAMQHPDAAASPFVDDWVSPIDFAKSHERRSLTDALRVPFRSVYSLEAYRKLDALLAREKPDVAHLQNVHFHLTPSILHACRKHGVPVVWTLHDYVLLCPVSHFLSHGRVCEACRPVRYHQAVLRRCQRGSVSASALAAVAAAVPRLLGSYRSVGRFITPSGFMRKKMLEFGFPDEQVTAVPNFLDCANIPPSPEASNYFLYVGRLSREKGARVLAEAAESLPEGGEVLFVGDGPEAASLKERFGDGERRGVRFLGRREGDALHRLFAGARAVVLPSLWYENFPMTILESYAHAKPVVASRIGALPDLVRDGENGLLFEPGNSADLVEKLLRLSRAPEEAKAMGKRGRAWVESELTPEAHYRRIRAIYDEVARS